MRAIDADALMKKLGIGKDCSVCEQDNTTYCSWNPNAVDVCEAICDAPTIEERKKGKWLPENRTIDAFWVCSSCGFPSEAHAANILYNFCPNCGADMRGEQDDSE